jgi:hypothetical protein
MTPGEDRLTARDMRKRAIAVRAAAAALEARSNALAVSMMKEMLAGQADILRASAAHLERRALEIEPPQGVA